MTTSADLTAARQARLVKVLDKLVRFDGVVRTWRGHLEELDFSHRREAHDSDGTIHRGLILRTDADEEVARRGITGLAFATYYEAPKLIVDYAATLGLPLVAIHGYDEVQVVEP